ncbi:aminoglycoside phosphotransferase family protein [Streptomyces sp. AcH 505]|uniref:aminoglycoside phosphotransferase family protein n=1 Tax=Streptomyces sp. AcH 505 TaxID=352211 RepID=UPI00099D7001
MLDIPAELVATQTRYQGAAGRAFIAELPDRAARFLDRWRLRVTGPSMYGMCALVLPVTRADGVPAVLKLQILDDETAGEPVALRAWGGEGAVRLLEYDGATGTLLLEALDPSRDLSRVEIREAVRIIAGTLARLTAVPAPAGLRTLGDIVARMLERVPGVLRAVDDPGERRLLADCAAAVREVAGEPGDRLLHWDLHFDNVLAAERAPWLAIDPKPLAGDPGFELLPALHNRFEAADVRWRFDLMTEVMGLDRQRAGAWTLARVLQIALWKWTGGEGRLGPDQEYVARALLAPRRRPGAAAGRRVARPAVDRAGCGHDS